MQITDGGFVTIIGGLIIMLGCCGTPRGVNPNDKTVMINPPGRTTTGGLMKTLNRRKIQISPMYDSHPYLIRHASRKFPVIDGISANSCKFPEISGMHAQGP